MSGKCIYTCYTEEMQVCSACNSLPHNPFFGNRATHRRDWNLRSTKPTANLTGTNVESGVAGGAGGGAGGWGGGLMPPRWVPDEEGVACVGCGKDFDWARRRVRAGAGGGVRGRSLKNTCGREMAADRKSGFARGGM